MASKENQDLLDLLEQCQPQNYDLNLTFKDCLYKIRKQLDELEFYKKVFKYLAYKAHCNSGCNHFKFLGKDDYTYACSGRNNCGECWEEYLLLKAQNELKEGILKSE